MPASVVYSTPVLVASITPYCVHIAVRPPRMNNITMVVNHTNGIDTQEKKCQYYTYGCAKSMSPVLTQCTCAEFYSVLKVHTCCLHICAILAFENVLLLMC